MPLIRNTSDNPASSGPDPAAALTSVSPDERWAAARAAADVPASLPALAQALAQEREPRVREAIFTALARIATPESALAVLPYLRSDEASIRIGALDALRAMPEAAKPHLPQALADADADVRLLACDLIRNMHDADAPRWLCALLETELEANVCAAAVEVLTEIGDAQALPTLWRCAARFPDDPFLGFAIKVAADRLRPHLPGSRG
jgi:HEAT repeat protein